MREQARRAPTQQVQGKMAVHRQAAHDGRLARLAASVAQTRLNLLPAYLVEETDDVAVIVEDDWGGGQGAVDADGEAAGWVEAEEAEAVMLAEAGGTGERGGLRDEAEGVGRVAGVRDLSREVEAGVVNEEVALLAAVGDAVAAGAADCALGMLVVALGANHQRMLRVAEVSEPHG